MCNKIKACNYVGKWKFRLPSVIKFVVIMTAMLVTTATSAAAQASAPQVGGRGGAELGSTLERLLHAAERIVPQLMQTVERPLGGWFDALSLYLGLLIALMYFAKLIWEQGGADPDSLYRYVARFACIFALLAYCGDLNGDGLRGDLLNRIGQFGNAVAYGSISQNRPSLLGRLVREEKAALETNYDKFVNNTFYVKIDNQERLISYPEDGARGFQMIAALYNKTYSLEQVAETLNPDAWDMQKLYYYISNARGLIELGDLFLIIVQGFVILTLRLIAPFAIAIAIDRDYAKRISIPLAWGAVVGLLILPCVSQLVRLAAYMAANFAMTLAPEQAYFRYDPATAKIVAVSDPVTMIMISAVIMSIFGLCMFASIWISYKLSQGAAFEAVTGAVAGWIGSGVSLGIGTVSGAAAAALNKQAELFSAGAAQQAGEVGARASLTSQNIVASGQAAASIAQSRAELVSTVGNLRADTWGANERAGATQRRLITEQNASVVGGDMTRNAEMINAGVTGQTKLDDAPVDNAGLFSTIVGGADNIIRAVGGYGSNSTVAEGYSPLATDVPGIPNRQTPFIPLQPNSGDGAQPAPQQTANGAGWGAVGNNMASAGAVAGGDHRNGLGYRPLDRSTGNRQWDKLIDGTARQLGMDPNFSVEIFRKETGGFQGRYVYGREKSPAGASGIGQFMPQTAQDYGLKVGGGVDERNNPLLAIPAAMRMHQKMLAAYGGNPLLAAGAYNAGKGAVDAHLPNNPVNQYTGGSGRKWSVSEATAERAQGIPQNRETRDYVATIGSRLGIGNYAMYQTPQGVRALMAEAGGNARTFTRAKRDAFIGMESAERTTQASAAADRYRAETAVNAGAEFTAAEIGINQGVLNLKTGYAVTANRERVAAAQGLERAQQRANQVNYNAQVGDPNAPAGSPERLGQLRIIEEAARRAADARARAAFVSNFGSNLASQANNLFTQFNRY